MPTGTERVVSGVITSYGVREGAAATTELIDGKDVVVVISATRRRFVVGGAANPTFLLGHMRNFPSWEAVGQKVVMTVVEKQGYWVAAQWGLSPDVMTLEESTASQLLFDRIVREVGQSRMTQIYGRDGSKICEGSIGSFAFIPWSLELVVVSDGLVCEHQGDYGHRFDLTAARLEWRKRAGVGIQLSSGEAFVMSRQGTSAQTR